VSDERERVRDSISEMRSLISRLNFRLDQIEENLSRLPEASGAVPPVEPVRARPAPVRPEPATAAKAASEWEPAAISVMVGRSLMVLGGAYLLRALTEASVIPVPAGVVAGLVYAAVFVVLAHRQAPVLRVSATFHGMMAAIIAMPLAVETAVRFGQLPASVAFGIIVLFGTIVGAIAVRNELKALLWITQSLTSAMLVVLIFGSRSFALGLWAFLTVALLSMIAARRLSSSPFLVLPAIFSNLLALALISLSLAEHTPPNAVVGIVSLLSFVAVWVTLLMFDARESSGRLGPGLLLQLALVVLIGVGGGLFVALRTDQSLLFAPLVGAIALATGVYGWRMVIGAGDRDRRSVSFVTVTTLLAMALTVSLFPPQATALIWIVLAALSFLAAKSGHRLLYESVTLLIVGAAMSSGLTDWIAAALFTMGNASSAIPSPAAIVTLVISLLFLRAAPPPSGKGTVYRWVINAATTLIVVGGCAAVAVHLVRMLLPLIGIGLDDLGAIAATRTIILSLTAIALAWLSRFPRARTIASLVIPVLVLTAILFMAVNVRVGRPMTHFPAFFVYGIALIVAPALKRNSLKERAKVEKAAVESSAASGSGATGEDATDTLGGPPLELYPEK
jgi:hypothetical protein